MEHTDLMSSEWGLALLAVEHVALLWLGWGTLHKSAQFCYFASIQQLLVSLHHTIDGEG
jgi:hypothetical protein